MQIEGARALVLRLIVGELLARRGEGPLARRPLAPAPRREVVGPLTSTHDRADPDEPAP